MNYLEMISQDIEEKENKIRKILFAIEQDIKFNQDDKAMTNAEKQHQQH